MYCLIIELEVEKELQKHISMLMKMMSFTVNDFEPNKHFFQYHRMENISFLFLINQNLQKYENKSYDTFISDAS